MNWNAGDILTIKRHQSKLGEGLTYPNMEVEATESGAAGGWDVYDGTQTESGKEVSFYGFSVEEVTQS